MWSLSELIVSSAVAVALLLALLTIAWGLHRQRHSAERDTQRVFEQLDLVRAEMMLLSERVQGLETTTPKAHERPAPQEIRTPAVTNAPAPRGYEVAARLARGGATCEELISACGLSRHEAELLMRLHKAEVARSKTGSSPPDKAQLRAGEEKRVRLAAVV